MLLYKILHSHARLKLVASLCFYHKITLQFAYFEQIMFVSVLVEIVKLPEVLIFYSIPLF